MRVPQKHAINDRLLSMNMRWACYRWNEHKLQSYWVRTGGCEGRVENTRLVEVEAGDGWSQQDGCCSIVSCGTIIATEDAGGRSWRDGNIQRRNFAATLAFMLNQSKSATELFTWIRISKWPILIFDIVFPADSSKCFIMNNVDVRFDCYNMCRVWSYLCQRSRLYDPFIWQE